jgi:Sulfotransferase family
VADLRIDDLREPQLTAEQQSVLEYGRTLDVPLAEDELVSRARDTTGLTDFGSDDFRPRLRAYLAAIDGDTGLNNLSRLTQRRRVVRLLSSRLLLTDLLHAHPEIAAIEIERPLIVVGLPRSGTTHLVNLIAADQRRRALPYWESQEPFPIAGDGPGVDGVDPRFVRCTADHAVEREMAPLTQAMHDRFPAAIEEEVELLDIDFASYTLEWHARVPEWRDFYLTLDQREHYAYMKTVLQALTFLRGPRQWVLKSPQHLEQLGPLMDTFPDATVAFTHRDPVAVIQSAITMLAYADRLRRDAVEPAPLAEYWIDRVEMLLRACVRDRDLVPADRSIDVMFHEFMADDIGTVERFYERAGVEMTTTARHQLDAYMAANPRGKHGRVVYDLEGDFGLRPEAVRERFDFYFDRFPVRAES